MVDVKDSILDSTKKAIGFDSAYTAFDFDIIMHINTVLSTLEQLGVGPDGGYMIEDKEALWTDLIGADKRLNSVKSYVFLRTRMLFDPPATSFLLQAYTEQIKEFEWRLQVVADPIDEFILEGGNNE